jgi:hypothetical protein
MVRSQPGQIVHETLSRKNPSQKKGWEWFKVLEPEFKPWYHKNKKQNKKTLGWKEN